VIGCLVAIALWVGCVAAAEPFRWTLTQAGEDAHAYWAAPADNPYAISQIGQNDAYLYSPAFVQVLAPIRALPWQAFMAAWIAILIIATRWLVGPRLLGPMLVIAVVDIWFGNITMLLAGAIVLGFRWPATWAFVLLTKVTPGIGLIWFAVRREWRNLAVALGATIAVIAISVLIGPANAWAAWFRVLAANAIAPVSFDSAGWSLPIPLVVRLPIAAGIVAWGALRNRRWVVPIACFVALPVLWYFVSYSMLAALVRLAPHGRIDRWRSWPERSPASRLGEAG
jgi:hypothetical protein